MRTVSQVAELAGVTVRALHHYDQIGLLHPSGRSEAGYRLYDRADLQRLQQIMFWRELEFELADIKRLLDDRDFDRVAALSEQRALLQQRSEQLAAIVKAVDAALEEERGGSTVTDEDMFNAFNDPKYAREAEERWGDTEAWRQSRQRAAGWSEDDKRRIVADGIAHAKTMAQAMRSGVAPDSEPAMDLAEQARRHIDEMFYDCGHEMHVNLGEMYVADPRFTQYYDQHGEGLAEWFRDAIRANARRHGVDA